MIRQKMERGIQTQWLKVLKRTPASKDNINMVKYMDSHEFSFHIDKDTGKFVSSVVKRK